MNKEDSTKRNPSPARTAENPSRPILKVDWCSHEAAKYAVEHWHYSKSLPQCSVRFGVWENESFVGVVLFGIGAGNSTNGKQYGLKRSHEIAELVRIAMRQHETPVSKIVAICIRMLKKQSPGLRMIISFADEKHGHFGGIYQAGNWVYNGCFEGDGGFVLHGQTVHNKTIHSRGWTQTLEWLQKHIDPKCYHALSKKHRYLMPLDDEMKKRIEPLRKPYPKKPCARSIDSDAPVLHTGEGGAEPTVALLNEDHGRTTD